MAKIYTSVAEIIGKTPLLSLTNTKEKYALKANIIAKLEFMNPAGSVKDRVGKSLIEDAEAHGLIKPDTVIIEPTSGNTGIGLAAVAASRGYKVIIVMPDTMSIERRKLMTAYGAELVLTDGKLGMSGAIKKAEELATQLPSAFIAGQFTNPANPAAHRMTTGPEIWEDTDGRVDVFVAGIGTGGTITGTAEYLKSQNDQIEIVGIEPDTSAVLSGDSAGPHKLQGIGAGFIPSILNVKIIDKIMKVSADDAYDAARNLGKNEGILVGISSGAALSAAIELAKLDEYEGRNIVVLLPDTGERYLSSDLF
ncbi:MAG: cysteine synthase A [Ruminococcaceae bacterium]|nr:cysteine synthase A [Oscillospiraceae bacterium]